ncbi:hypothetical protein MATL_G00004910 [Megalops atlanticus]|uniref:Uncharacterized protein n=1 Tax=Megalops atlanticus TaxID=7932 RepID=A0A9D3QJ35_MEGAT|nr:hypothetical protein MATL_G00004910 [Megalops atlanticus]
MSHDLPTNHTLNTVWGGRLIYWTESRSQSKRAGLILVDHSEEERRKEKAKGKMKTLTILVLCAVSSVCLSTGDVADPAPSTEAADAAVFDSASSSASDSASSSASDSDSTSDSASSSASDSDSASDSASDSSSASSDSTSAEEVIMKRDLTYALMRKKRAAPANLTPLS